MPRSLARHPAALGMVFADVWPDVWTDISPLVDRVFAGETTTFQAMPLVMTRNGYCEDTWWDFSYSPVHDETGKVAALLNVTSDATPPVSWPIASVFWDWRRASCASRSCAPRRRHSVTSVTN